MFMRLEITMKLITGFVAVLSLTALFIFVRNPANAQGVSVVVNNQHVNFTGTTPVEKKGAVLVPLRGVFEALGAKVNYNPTSKTIVAQKGERTVTLSIGSTSAYVNGKLQPLSQPAEVVNGSTFVPLRFVAEALSAYVQWVAASQTVQITTPEAHLSTLPAPSLPSGSPAGQAEVTGQLTGVYTDTVPEQITVRMNGQNTAIPIDDNTIVLIRQNGQQGTPADIHALDIGDQVRVKLAYDGSAAAIEAVYGEVVGTVKNIQKLADGTYLVNLNDGTSIPMSRDADALMAGRHIEFGDVMPAERVRIRTGQQNKVGYSLDVLTGTREDNLNQQSSASPLIKSFTSDVKSVVGRDSVVHFSLLGTPGEIAAFTIPSLIKNAPMTEVAPGQYEGRYVVPGDVSVTGNVTAQLIDAASLTVITSQVSCPITIDSIPPSIASENPAPDTTVSSARPQIYALIDDGKGPGIDDSSVKLKIDGVDVTKSATVTAHFVTYQPATAIVEGKHAIDLAVSDKAGNHADRTWSFSSGPQHTTLIFKSDRSGRSVSLRPTDVLNLTLYAMPGGSAFATIGGVHVAMVEARPGEYTGRVKASTGSKVNNATVTAHFSGPDHTDVTQSLGQLVSFDVGRIQPPQISSPRNGAEIGNNLQVAGVSSPGTTVDVTVNYTTKALGLLSITGTAAQTQVIADDNGKWQTDKMALATPGLLSNSHNTDLTIKATSIDQSGQRSPCSQIKVLFQ
jgi:hypothetical protein